MAEKLSACSATCTLRQAQDALRVQVAAQADDSRSEGVYHALRAF